MSTYGGIYEHSHLYKMQIFFANVVYLIEIIAYM